LESRRKHWSHNNSKPALHSPSSTSAKSFDLQVANWRMESIVRDSDSGSEDEFFDCQGMQTHKILDGLAAFMFCVVHNDMNNLRACSFRIFGYFRSCGKNINFYPMGIWFVNLF
jgi:hypothetical protein